MGYLKNGGDENAFELIMEVINWMWFEKLVELKKSGKLSVVGYFIWSSIAVLISTVYHLSFTIPNWHLSFTARIFLLLPPYQKKKKKTYLLILSAVQTKAHYLPPSKSKLLEESLAFLSWFAAAKSKARSVSSWPCFLIWHFGRMQQKLLVVMDKC